MQIKPSPLTVIIDPPGVQSGMPGDTLELHTVVSNQGNHGAVIDVFFDEASQTLQEWCSSARKRLALDPQQSSEVTFQFQIPLDALPGTYDYTLVVDAPEHFPEDTPIQYPRQIKVLLKEQTVVRVNDPTFSLTPTTNPSNPVILKPGEPLQVVVTVDNRSNRVDRFRLTCPDLEEDWFTIRYLTTGLEGPGLLSGASGLELNPAAFGQILLQLHPPADTLAGSYSPTIRLHSANSPDLVLLDLVYIQIPAVYRLDLELNTILGKVSRSPGQYEVKLANRGNTLRELEVSAKSRDEEELCTYQCEPSQVRVLPTRSVGVNLTVKPIRWWRRPLIGAGLALNFIVELQDSLELPLPEKLPEGTLIWKPRPWWQFLLLVLAVLGLLGGVAFIVWLLFFKTSPPLELVSFDSDSPTYTEGKDQVRLSWELRNPNQLSKLVLSSSGPVPSEDVTYDPNSLESLCEEKEKEQALICTNVTTDARQAGKYTFELKAFNRQGERVPSLKKEVEIFAKPEPKVVSFQPESFNKKYIEGDRVLLSWVLQNSNQLLKLNIVGKTEDGTVASGPVTYDFSQGIPDQLTNSIKDGSQPSCQEQKQVLTCKNVPVATSKPGRYTFELQAFSKSGKPPLTQATQGKVEVLPKPVPPPKIISFTLNGIQAPGRVSLLVNQPVTLRWQVEGEGVRVTIPPFGEFSASGSLPLQPYTQARQDQIILTATDKSGQTTNIGFSIEVQAPAPPSSPFPQSAPKAPTPSDRGI